MNEIDYAFFNQEATRPTGWTAVTYIQLITPILTAACSIILELKGEHPFLLAGFVVATVVAILVGPFNWVWPHAAIRLDQVRDNRAARRYVPHLTRHVERFGEFVGGNSDTLHAIIASTAVWSKSQKLAQIQLPNVMVWKGQQEVLFRRLTEQEPNALGLELAAIDLGNMVGTYVNLCAAMIFEHCSKDTLAELDDRSRKELGALQQNLERFRADSQELLLTIRRSRPRFAALHYQFTKVKPLA